MDYFNYQTLFDKDYYVILRPEMLLVTELEALPGTEPQIVNVPSTGVRIILTLIISVIVITIGVLCLLRFKLSKSSKSSVK